MDREITEKWAYSTSLTNNPLTLFEDRLDAMYRAHHNPLARVFQVEVIEYSSGETEIRRIGPDYGEREAAIAVAPLYARRQAHHLGKLTQ